MAAIDAWDARGPVGRDGSFAFHPFAKQLVPGAVPDQDLRFIHLYVSFGKINLRMPGQLDDVIRPVEKGSIATGRAAAFGNDNIVLSHGLPDGVRSREEIGRELVGAETGADRLVRSAPPFLLARHDVQHGRRRGQTR